MRKIYFLIYFIKLRLMVLLHIHHTTNPLDFDWRFRHWHGSTSMRGQTSHSAEKTGILETNTFFRIKEIEMLVGMEHITIPFLLILDDVAFLEEQSLMDIGMILAGKN